MITDEDGTTSLKLEVEWTNDNYNEALGNFKALNAMFSGVDKTRV